MENINQQKITDLSGLGSLISEQLVGKKAEKTQEPIIQQEVKASPIVEAKKEEAKIEVKTEELVVENGSVVETVKQKTFEELLEERSGGKYKNWEDVDRTINTEHFADDTIKKINEYVKQGGSFDDWVSTQSVKVDELTLAESIAMDMSLQNPDMSDEEIELEMKMKYGFDKWKDNVEDYEDGTEPDEIRILKLKFDREAKKATQKLKDYQQKWSVPQNKLEDQVKQQDLLQSQWNENVDLSIKSVNKIPIKVSDKETFEYVISPEEVKEANKTIKELFADSNALFKGYIDSKKPMGVNMEGLTEMVLKAKNFEKIMSFAVGQARSAGAEKVVKDIKNISFNADGKKQEVVPKTFAKAVEESLLKNRIRV